MQVFKFGGASVKDATSVKNVAEIIKLYPGDDLVIVVSAMGKTTNELEKVVHTYFNDRENAHQQLNESKQYHQKILEDLFTDTSDPVFEKVNNFFVEIDWVLDEEPRSYGFVYDQIVSIGELISTAIVSAYLNSIGIKNKWEDVRDILQTDNTWREAKVNWELSTKLMSKKIPALFTSENHIVITQGFIGNTSENYTSTLGREGSDYTAAILAHVLNADSVSIWKDVPGVLNADPKYFNDAQKLEQISYLDAIELAYYGASVIHPKTIKPLENKNIPLYVKSFLNPASKGTLIACNVETKPLIPSFIFKTNQVLVSILAKDFSFIAEENLSNIFSCFASCSIKLNLIQNSAISFSVCMDNDTEKLTRLVELLQKDYKVLYNINLELYTIRHYFASTIDTLTQNREILLEQRSRNTAQIVMKVLEK